jgi:hypothetical protein
MRREPGQYEQLGRGITKVYIVTLLDLPGAKSDW